MGQNGLKTTSLITSLNKKSASPNQKIFFQVQSKNCLIHLSPWTAL